MALPAARAPPALGVKINVAATPALDATRSTAAIEKEAKATAPPMTPDEITLEGNESELVRNVTPPPAVGTPPMVRPDNVTATAEPADSVVPEVINTMEVAPDAPMEEKNAPPDMAPVGVTPEAKKLLG